MKKKTPRCLRPALGNRWARIFRLSAAMPLLLLLAGSTTFAGDAQWNLTPGSNDWNTAGNWTPTTVPNGAADTATFGTSNTTDVSMSANTEVSGIAFNAGAFTITVSPSTSLTVSGAGITNGGNFVTTGAFFSSRDTSSTIMFLNSATAGTSVFSNNGDRFGNSGGLIIFRNTSTAGDSSFDNNGGILVASPGSGTEFFDTSTAGNGTFTNAANDPEESGGGFTQFFNTSSAGSGTFYNQGGTTVGNTNLFNGPGNTYFNDSSTAANATLFATGGTRGGFGGSIQFSGNSTGGTARVEVFGNGFMAFHSGGFTVGSIEGDGIVRGGDLTVGSNNLSTTFSGVLSIGSLTKIGAGTLALSGANTYTGGTSVNAGTLLVNNTSGSGTGSGDVQVNAGTLGGSGTIAGAVTVGTGSGRGAFLSPGQSAGTLTIQSVLTLNSDATYKFELDRSTMTADEVVANGVTINGAKFSFTGIHGRALARGTVLTVIDNTAASLIAGVFANLPDDSTFKYKGNTFEVSYDGGDGNDLTLTAIKGKKSKRNAFAFSNETRDVNDLTLAVIAPVPEPSSWVLIATGAIILMAFMRCGSRKSSLSA